ncbi:MAG TPA: DNA alkylation repair protein [Terriglobia bacterium]|nr:DNA alkylation repair protein [Terriglobia bacterium]
MNFPTQQYSCSEILAKLNSMANPEDRAGMARFGITVDRAFGGVATPVLKKLARQIGKDHRLAQELWKSGYHEARHLAALIDEPAKVTQQQLERWARDFDSWDVVDGCCLNLFVRTPYAHAKAVEWSRRKEEYVKRAAFSLMAVLAVHDKQPADATFLKFLTIIKRESIDERNFVKKAVNWALRQIGKRNRPLNTAAIRAAKQIRQIDSRSARWIAADALRELTSDAVQHRLRERDAKR